jgi:peroxiredoxin
MRFTSKNTVSPVRFRGVLMTALLGVIILASAAVPAAGETGAPAVGTSVGDVAPDFTANNFHGGTVRLADHRGKVVLLDFWASWCGPCMRDMPTLVKIKDRFPADKFVIIGISLDMEKSLSRMKQVIIENKLDYPITFDGKGWRNAVSSIYGVRSIPATLFSMLMG